jgi:putative hydrolase of the HAD superfamily
MKSEMGFQDIFDQLFFSCEMGYQKPAHAYYQHIKKMLKLENESILFWDDSPLNVKAARECGWNAEIYTDFSAFEEITKKYISPNHSI